MSISSLAGAASKTFGGGGARATIDVSDIVYLASLLERAADLAPEEAENLLDQVVPRVAAEARATAASYPHATGETAGSIGYDTFGDTRRVWAASRAAWFLEYGSPNTGAPRAFLSGPAEEASRYILEHMAEVGDIW